MKQLFFILSGISFITLNTTKSIKIDVDESMSIECPECKTAFNECSVSVNKIYADAVERASDSISSKTNKVHFSDACAEARKIRDKALAECRETYQKCCLSETKTGLEKEEQ